MELKLLERLKILLSKEEIRDVLLRYARATDRCDRDGIAACFHEDAIDDHGAGWCFPASELPDRIVEAVRQTTNAVTHFLGNTIVEVEGDIAYAESYFQATHDFIRDDRRYLRCRAGRYIDRFERRSEHWKISERVVVDDWNRVDEVKEMQVDVEKFRHGTKDFSDAVFAIKQGRVASVPE